MARAPKIVLPLDPDLYEALRAKMVEIGREEAVRESGVINMDGVKIYANQDAQASLNFEQPTALVEAEEKSDDSDV